MTTLPLGPTLAALGLAYLIGSIPFGFLVARLVRGVDIRTLGSGNIGATNVGRVLGFRFFVVVFLLDFLKGYLPTRFLPGLTVPGSPDLPVLVAVGTILGHNFPIFLGLRGGKGVATSLGAVAALDWVASLGAALGFGTLLASFRFVSVGSLGGGIVWLVLHFSRTPHPWGRDQVTLTVASMVLMGLLIVRHRSNLARLAAGTEPRVTLRRRNHPVPTTADRPDLANHDRGADAPSPSFPPGRSGRVAPALLIGLALLSVGTALGLAGFFWASHQREEVIAGPYHAEEVARAATGHQRVESLAFADNGRLLAVTCPRYGRVVYYRIREGKALEPLADFEVGGRPVALAAGPDRVYVLTRPSNDARHIHEGWWQAFGFDGQPLSPRVGVGLYPDDFALVGTAEAPRLLVLASGRGEGDAHRPAAALTVYDLTRHPDEQAALARVDFEGPGDDPGHLAVALDGQRAAVALIGPKPAVIWVDIADLNHPQILQRREWPAASRPDSLRFDADGSLLVTDDGAEFLWHQASPNAEPTSRAVDGGTGDVVTFHLPNLPDFWAYTLPFDSGVAFLPAGAPPSRPHDRMPLLGGRAKLTGTRPVGLAIAPAQGLIAVGNRSGGSVHLIRVRPSTPDDSTSRLARRTRHHHNPLR